MNKLLFVALLLATPVAAAQDGIEINPVPTDECESASDGDWSSGSYGSNNSYSWWSSSWYTDSWGCAYRDDTVDGGVYANGNEVVDVNAGSGSEHDSSYSGASGSSAREFWSDGFYHYGYSGYSNSSQSYGSSSGNDATVSTLLLDAGYAERCWDASSNSQGQDSWNSYTSSWGWYEDGGSTSYNESSAAAGCDRGVALASGVTDVSAGRADACESHERADAWQRYWVSDSTPAQYESGSWERSTTSCVNAFYAEVGEESLLLGSTTGCEAHSAESSEPWGNSTHTSSSGSECEARDGFFGPTDLAVYLSQRGGSWSSCGDFGCEDGSYEQRALVVEHAYTGRTAIVLP